MVWTEEEEERELYNMMLYDLVLLGSGMYLMRVCVGLENGRVKLYLGYLARRSLL